MFATARQKLYCSLLIGFLSTDKTFIFFTYFSLVFLSHTHIHNLLVVELLHVVLQQHYKLKRIIKMKLKKDLIHFNFYHTAKVVMRVV